MNKKKIFGIIKWFWLLLVLVAAGYYFYSHQEEVINLIKQIDSWRIFLSLILLLIGKSFLVILVKFSVNSEGWDPSYFEMLGVYGLSSLGKYLPGGIWHFVGRFGVYKMNNLSGKASTRSLILENIWLLSSALAIGVIGVFLTRFDLVANILGIPDEKWLAITFTIAILALWIISLSIINKIMQKYTSRLIHKVAVVALIGLLLWTFIGGSFFVLFQNAPFASAPLFIGGYSVSWAVGYIAIFAPGGLGIREAVLAFVFSNIASVELIAVYAAMNRIIWVVAEVFFGLVGMFQKKIMPPSTEVTVGASGLESKELITKPSVEDSDIMVSATNKILEPSRYEAGETVDKE